MHTACKSDAVEVIVLIIKTYGYELCNVKDSAGKLAIEIGIENEAVACCEILKDLEDVSDKILKKEIKVPERLKHIWFHKFWVE